MGLTGVQKVKVQNRTCDAIIEYDGDRGEILKELQRFSYQQTEVPADYLKNSGREMNQYYWDKLVNRVILHYGTKLFLPISVRDVIATVKSVKYVCEGYNRTCFQARNEWMVNHSARFLTERRSVFRYSVEITARQAPSCSC